MCLLDLIASWYKRCELIIPKSICRYSRRLNASSNRIAVDVIPRSILKRENYPTQRQVAISVTSRICRNSPTQGSQGFFHKIIPCRIGTSYHYNCIFISNYIVIRPINV